MQGPKGIRGGTNPGEKGKNSKILKEKPIFLGETGDRGRKGRSGRKGVRSSELFINLKIRI